MIDAVITFFLLMLSSLITPWVLNTLGKRVKDDDSINFIFLVLFLLIHVVGLFVIMGFGLVNEKIGVPMGITAFTACSFFSLVFSSFFYCSGADGAAGHSIGMKHFIRASVVLNIFIAFISSNFVM